MRIRLTWSWVFVTLAVLVPLAVVEAPRFVHTSIETYFVSQQRADLPCCSPFEFLWLFLPHTMFLVFGSLALAAANPGHSWLRAARLFALAASVFVSAPAAALVYTSIIDDWTSDEYLQSPMLGKLVVMPTLLIGPVVLVSLAVLAREA